MNKQSDQLNFKALIKELLKRLRGERSQEVLNRKFGFTFNQIYRWESGVTKMSWNEFTQFCHYLDIPLEKITTSLITGLPEEAPISSPNLIRQLLGNMGIEKFATRYKLSRKAVSKWLSGDSTPNLEQVLFLFHNHAGQLVKWLDKLVGSEHLPSMKQTILRLRIREAVTYKYPEVSLILNYLQTKPFLTQTHYRPGALAKKFGLTVEQEEEIMQGLLQSGTIVPHKESFRVGRYDVFRINATPEQMALRYTRYLQLFQEALKRGELKSPPNYFYHMVFPGNQKQLTQLKNFLRHQTAEFSMQIADEADIENFDKVMVYVVSLVQVDGQ